MFLASPDATAGDTGLKGLQRNRHPAQGCTAGCDHALLQLVQTDAGKAQASLPVGIHQRALAAQADGVALHAAEQHSDGNHQQQPIDPHMIPQSTALELKDPRLLVAEQLLAAEELALGRVCKVRQAPAARSM
jgi:hypothetical protein